MKRMLIRFFFVAATNKIAIMILPGSPGQLVARTGRRRTILGTPVMRTGRPGPGRRSWSSWSSWGPLSSAGWPSSRPWCCLSSTASGPGQYHGSASWHVLLSLVNMTTWGKLCSLIGWHHLSFSSDKYGLVSGLWLWHECYNTKGVCGDPTITYLYIFCTFQNVGHYLKIYKLLIAGRKGTTKRPLQEAWAHINSGSIFTLG